MIKLFRDKPSRKFYLGERVANFSDVHPKQAAKAFDQLAAAERLEDLMVRPSLHFEALQGRAGVYSVRINRRWRVEFGWDGEHVVEVAVTKHYEQ